MNASGKLTYDQEQKLRSAYNAASAQVAKCLRMSAGGSKAEQKYGRAYQALVRAGLAPQIRARYRP